MYKTIISKEIAKELQWDRVDMLNQLLNNEYENGWELVSMTTIPLMVSHYCNYVLIFKKRNN